MVVLAVRPREIPIYVFLCALSLLIAKSKLRKEKQTQNHASSETPIHAEDSNLQKSVPIVILHLPILSFSLFSEMLLVCYRSSNFASV